MRYLLLLLALSCFAHAVVSPQKGQELAIKHIPSLEPLIRLTENPRHEERPAAQGVLAAYITGSITSLDDVMKRLQSEAPSTFAAFEPLVKHFKDEFEQLKIDESRDFVTTILKRAKSAVAADLEKGRDVRPSQIALEAKKLAKEVLEGFTALSVPAQTDLKSSFSDLFLLVEQSEITMSDLQ
ncbi:hypothetical protein PRIPAC_92357 [Pristionchus pacificus]|uniref:Uncharacterized protein n=1 Tax=Pristionchus pacificus TaxID=54126 RepID=A0A454XJ09_PRIPA|nr:hypothetical protein PRIPAC_92357 [Pristionchus pacificus]|eukprot:PDM76053.1 hypothetical protein PRIPAC_39657 [Pristionchus pacificus]